MYKVLGIVKYDATRSVTLRDMNTSEIEECFDDSALVSQENFNFIQIGELYDCKIKLFGKVVSEKNGRSVTCKVINREILVGKKVMTEVSMEGKRYYIAPNKLKKCWDEDVFNFSFTRKDLIQVNNVIHADYL